MKKSKLGSDLNEKQIQIINELFSYGSSWDEYIPPMKETLMKLLLCYIKSEDIEENKEERDNVAYNVYILNDILDSFLKVEGARTPPDKEKPVCIECLKKEGVIELLTEQSSEKDKRIKGLITGAGPDCKLVVLKRNQA
jgi:hypothetical protein